MKTPRLVLPTLLCALVLTCARAAAPEPRVTTLDNGVTVVLIENRQSPVVSLRCYVRAGSMNEGDQGKGMTHLLEHLVAGAATARRTEAQGRELLDSIGAQSNAYTSRDHACYYITTSSRFFDTALDLLGDWVLNATIPPGDFQRELEVIQREMESRRSDPATVLHETMAATMFSVHPARYPVLGFRDSFRGITRDEVYAYYRRTYVPDNLIVVAAGDLTPAEALRKITETFGKTERRPVPLYAFPAEPPQVAAREAARELPVSQAYALFGWRSVTITHPDMYPLDLLAYILANGDTSRLVRRLREEQRLVNAVSASSYTPGYDAGAFEVQVRLRPEKLAAARAALLAEVRRAREELVSDEELDRAKKQKAAEHVFDLQTAEAQGASAAIGLLSAGDARFSGQYVRRIQETTAEEIRRAARKYLTEETLSVVVVTPPAAAPAAASAAEGPVEQEIVRTVLPNGLRLLVRRNATQPIVSIGAFMAAGVRADPPGKSGLSSFTARMMTRGTATRNAVEVAAALEDIGGDIAAASGNHALYVTASCLSADLPRALETTADVVRNPSFPPQEIDRLRPLVLAAIERQKDNWREQLFQAFRRTYYRAHPYRNSAIGLAPEVAALTREDIVAFHRGVAAPGNLVLCVFGDVDPAQVKALVEQRFGDWPAGKRVAPQLAAEPTPAEDRVVAETTALKMGGVFVGWPGMTLRDEKDRHAMDVLDSLVSGIHLPRGWLHETLRGRGLVYEVHAFNFAGIEPGYFGAYAGCEPGKVEEVRALIIEQLGRLVKEKLTEAELDAARRTCVTADVLENQTNAQQAMRAGVDELLGLGCEASKRYAPGVLAVTEADVRRVAQKYLTHSVTVMLRPEKK
jgi:zinc protease